MDELKIKQAVETIQLSDMQKQRLLKRCRETKQKKRPYLRTVAAAACAGIVLLSGTWMWHGDDTKSVMEQESVTDRNLFGFVDFSKNEALSGSVQIQESGRIENDLVIVNEWDENQLLFVMSSPLEYDEREYERVNWTWQNVEEYVGRSLTDFSIPEDLQPSPFNGKDVQIIRDRQTGRVVWDAVFLDFWNDWQDYESGGERRTDWDGGRGFSVLISKLGLRRCGVIIPPEETLKMSQINGTEVMIGHRVFGAKYNEKGEPEMKYDVYLVRFTCNDVQYELKTSGMTLEEIVSVVKVLITTA